MVVGSGKRFFAARLKAALNSRGMEQQELARRLRMSEITVSRWVTEKMLPPPGKRRIIERELQLPDGWLDVQEEPGATVGRERSGAVREHRAEYLGDARGSVEGSGSEIQLSNDEVIEMFAHDRPRFVRYLQNQFGDQPLSTAAKLDRLSFILEIARERGIPEDKVFIDGIRALIQSRGL